MKIFTLFRILVLSCLCPVLAQAQSWQSALAVPSTGGNSVVSDIVADGAGGYVVTGTFFGTLTLGSFTLTNANNDIFVARLTAAGQWTQAVNAGGTGTKIVRALALDAGGGVVVAGTFTGATATIGSVTLTNSGTQNEDMFVARLSAAGQWTQAVAAGGPFIDAVNDLVVNPANGTATVVGNFVGGTCTFGPRSLTGASTGALFVARLNTSGTWTQAVGVTSSGTPSSASGVALDAAGNAVVCGFYRGSGTIQFGSIALASTSATAFVARLSVAGTWTQAVQATSTGGFAAAGQVAVEAAGNVVVAGNFRDASVSFGSYTLPYTASSDNLFVARLSSAGVWTQAAQAADSGNSFPQGISLAADGSVWVAGQFRSPLIRFGSTTLTNPNTAPIPPNNTLTTDIFVARLSAAGSWTYAAQAGGLNDDFPSAVLLDGSRVLVTGGFGPAPASFGPLTLTTSGNATGFIAGLGGGILPTKSAVGAASLALAPNPATATTLLTLPAGPGPRVVQVLDMLGRAVHSQLVAAHATSATIAVAGLKPGIYLVSCESQTQRLVVE
ncbi:MAG: T9SS type A sorting domain-containing protein [Cytophagaceae bacterium]|nr:MAG: T9SS type A sorting domain-containing protein [Cytophagaceae bacterium]